MTLASVEVNSPSQVTLRLNQPNAGLPTMLTNRIGCMVSPQSLKDKGGNIDRVAVGTGPFKFVDWKDNDSFKLVRNENYWKTGQPYLDGIDIRIINELNTLVRTVVSGETDLGINLQVPQKLIADRAPNVVAEVSPSLIFFGAFLNYAKPPLDDLRVRQAMNYALDREEINKVDRRRPRTAVERGAAEGALGVRSGDTEFLHARPRQGEEAPGGSRPPERTRDRVLRAGPISSPCSARN